jgi:hypothetical protein
MEINDYNKEIIHYVKRNRSFKIWVYICNTAVHATKHKMTHDWSEVTCKNCMRKMPPEGAKRILEKVGLI